MNKTVYSHQEQIENKEKERNLNCVLSSLLKNILLICPKERR